MVLPLIIESFQSMTKPGVRDDKMDIECSRFIADPNLHAIVLLCLVGLLLTLNFVLRSPDLGAVIAQYNQF
jgi:hypothetical protein